MVTQQGKGGDVKGTEMDAMKNSKSGRGYEWGQGFRQSAGKDLSREAVRTRDLTRASLGLRR